MNLKYENFIEDTKEVLRTLVCKELELQADNCIWYQMRILPFRTISNVIDGVVITFLNINNLKTAYEEINKLNQEIQLAREYADNIIDTVGDSLLILDKDLKVLSANRSFYKTFNTISENIEGKFIYELDNKKWDKPQLRELLEQIIPRRNHFEDYEIEYDFTNEGYQKLIIECTPDITR